MLPRSFARCLKFEPRSPSLSLIFSPPPPLFFFPLSGESPCPRHYFSLAKSHRTHRRHQQAFPSPESCSVLRLGLGFVDEWDHLSTIIHPSSQSLRRCPSQIHPPLSSESAESTPPFLRTLNSPSPSNADGFLPPTDPRCFTLSPTCLFLCLLHLITVASTSFFPLLSCSMGETRRLKHLTYEVRRFILSFVHSFT